MSKTNDNNEFKNIDVSKILGETTKQYELFNQVDAPYYLKERIKDYNYYEYEKDKDDFELDR